MQRKLSTKKAPLSVAMPKAFEELNDVRKRLENHFDDMQDIEFTIQENKLWMLQTRRGKRTGDSQKKYGV